MNPIALTDLYKTTHWQQYPRKTKGIYSYFEARKPNNETMFLGLSYLIQRYFLDGLHYINHFNVKSAKRNLNRYFGAQYFDANVWDMLISGPLPLRIKAVPEGTVVPSGNVLMTVESIDPRFYWLTNYIETLLVQLWYPSTVGTIARQVRQSILRNLEKTGTPAQIDMKLHDFGVRASTCMEQACIGGLGHLASFNSTDNWPALEYADEFYDCPHAGVTVPASEHSTMTSWGKAHEADAYENMLEVYQGSPVSIVADSWDIYNACKDIFGRKLRDKIEARGASNPLVVRPDSGDPVKVTLKVIEILGEQYTPRVNEKGYKVLPDYIRILQGDGVTPAIIQRILDNYETHGWSGDNIAFGMGGNLLQNCNRDTYGFAFKCSAMFDGDKYIDVYKEPKTDPSKNSKRGRLKLIKRYGHYKTVPHDAEGDDLMVTYYDNGIRGEFVTLNDIRKRARA